MNSIKKTVVIIVSLVMILLALSPLMNSQNTYSVSIKNGSTSQAIPDYADEFQQTFTESGLPAGTTWYVNITGYNSGPITGTSYSVSLSNGTYSYTVATSDHIYKPTVYTGSFTVDGASLSESVTFVEVTYTVTFTETGLPSGTLWSVTLNGTTLSSTTSTITFSEPNGTYTYSIGSVSGYTVSLSSGSLTAIGKTVNQSITFTAKPSSSGLSTTELYAIIGVVVAAAIIGAALAVIMRKKK
jgi:hypothetical protein